MIHYDVCKQRLNVLWSELCEGGSPDNSEDNNYVQYSGLHNETMLVLVGNVLKKCT